MTLRLDLPLDQTNRLRATARLRALRVANETRFATHPWPFLRDAVYTFDPFKNQEAGGGVQKYPGILMRDPTPTCRCCVGGCDNYLHHVVNIWFEHPRSVWAKSRRLIMSWTFIALHVWLARYRPGQVIALVSRKQGQNEDEGSAELIKRARFIEDHLPAEVQPRETHRTWCRTAYPHSNSVMLGIAQGADQLRQLAITAWLGDEFAFWEQAGATYAASIPTLEGGGRCTLISTANPGFMRQLVFDQWHVASGG
jgi:hypothetical protein